MYADNCEGLNSEEQLEQGHSAANLSKEWIKQGIVMKPMPNFLLPPEQCR